MPRTLQFDESDEPYVREDEPVLVDSLASVRQQFTSSAARQTSAQEQSSAQGQPSVLSRAKRKAEQAQLEQQRSRELLTATVTSSVASTVQATLAVSPTSKAERSAAIAAAVEMNKAKTAHFQEQARQQLVATQLAERNARVANLQSCLSNTELCSVMLPAQVQMMRDELMQLLMTRSSV